MSKAINNKAIIIGAGIAGIASAIRLKVKGYDVLLLEKNSYPGGKLSEFTREGFRFDAGPSLFTMPQYVDELFVLAGKNPRDYFNYERLDITAKYFYEDGTVINAYGEQEKFIEELHRQLDLPKFKIKKFLKYSERIYKITNHVFIERSLHQLKTYLRWETLRSILRLPQIDSFRSMHSANKNFFTKEKAVQFFNRYATYNGSNPYKAPATLNVIHHLEHAYGAWLPKYGMYHITQSLIRLAKDLGVDIIYNSDVKEIKHKNNKVIGLNAIIDDTEVFCKADVIVSNMDIYHTYRKLLKNIQAPEYLLQQEKSSSALIFYWGMRKNFDALDVHNIFFSENYFQEFQHIEEGKIFNDPTVYINITSKKIQRDAPANSENWFVMINVPHNKEQNWDILIENARINIIQKLNRMLNTNIEEYIQCEEILDPRSIETKTSSHKGALYGNSSNNRYAAFLRHSNKSKQLQGLYFCGGSVHPGGGIPLALMSAKIASSFIPNN